MKNNTSQTLTLCYIFLCFSPYPRINPAEFDIDFRNIPLQDFNGEKILSPLLLKFYSTLMDLNHTYLTEQIIKWRILK